MSFFLQVVSDGLCCISVDWMLYMTLFKEKRIEKLRAMDKQETRLWVHHEVEVFWELNFESAKIIGDRFCFYLNITCLNICIIR